MYLTTSVLAYPKSARTDPKRAGRPTWIHSSPERPASQRPKTAQVHPKPAWDRPPKTTPPRPDNDPDRPGNDPNSCCTVTVLVRFCFSPALGGMRVCIWYYSGTSLLPHCYCDATARVYGAGRIGNALVLNWYCIGNVPVLYWQRTGIVMAHARPCKNFAPHLLELDCADRPPERWRTTTLARLCTEGPRLPGSSDESHGIGLNWIGKRRARQIR